MLEHKIFDMASDDIEEFGDELLALCKGNVGFSSQALPKLFTSRDGVSVGFGGSPFLS